jgi:hypothetical protein
MSKQQTLNLPLAGQIADVRDKLAADNPKWGNRPTLTCACCGERYRRGEWKCCAPQGGMASAIWFRQWHHDCPTADAAEGPGKRKCPKHCRCPRQPDGNLVAAAPLTIEETKVAVEKIRHPSPERTASLPVDEAFLKSEWPDEEAQ